MFAGLSHDWRRRLVIQCRVRVTRTLEKCWSHVYYAAKVSLILTEKLYFYVLWICKMYIVL